MKDCEQKFPSISTLGEPQYSAIPVSRYSPNSLVAQMFRKHQLISDITPCYCTFTARMHCTLQVQLLDEIICQWHEWNEDDLKVLYTTVHSVLLMYYYFATNIILLL
jgi:hypothetical protein